MHLLSLVRNVPRDRFDITLAFFKEEAQEARSLVPDFKAFGVNVVNLRMPYWWNLSVLWRLYRLLKKNDFDVVHTHLFRADIFGPILSRMAGVPKVVTTIHNTERFFKYLLIKFVLNVVNDYVHQVIAISRAVKTYLVKEVGFDPGKICVVYYGIDVNNETYASSDQKMNSMALRNLTRQKLNLPAKAVIIGTVGRLSRQKGHPYLLEAFAKIHKKCPETRLLIVGHDDQRLGPKLESLATQMGIREKVWFTGYLDGREAMKAMDLFVLPSLWEGFGLVLLEAIAMELPIIATNVTAIPEIVLHEETGLLVPPSDSDALANAIQLLLESPEDARLFAYRGRKYVQQTFSIERMVKATTALYDKPIPSESLRLYGA